MGKKTREANQLHKQMQAAMATSQASDELFSLAQSGTADPLEMGRLMVAVNAHSREQVRQWYLRHPEVPRPDWME